MNIQICHRCDSCQALSKNGGCVGPCACLADSERRDIIWHAENNDCPLGKYPGTIRRVIGSIVDAIAGEPKPQPPQRRWIEIEGPALWAELHRWALHGDIDRPLLWLGEFTAKLGSCDCGGHWRQWMLDNPPDVSNREALFEWTWRAHEAVNARLGKAGMTFDEARARWS